MPLEKEEVIGRDGKFSLATGHIRTTQRELLKGFFMCRERGSLPTRDLEFTSHPTDGLRIYTSRTTADSPFRRGCTPQPEILGPISISWGSLRVSSV